MATQGENKQNSKSKGQRFRTKEKSKKFYVTIAINDYIKSEAQLKALIDGNIIDEETLDKLKVASKKNIDKMADELTTYITDVKKEPIANTELSNLLNTIEE